MRAGAGLGLPAVRASCSVPHCSRDSSLCCRDQTVCRVGKFLLLAQLGAGDQPGSLRGKARCGDTVRMLSGLCSLHGNLSHSPFPFVFFFFLFLPFGSYFDSKRFWFFWSVVQFCLSIGCVPMASALSLLP